MNWKIMNAFQMLSCLSNVGLRYVSLPTLLDGLWESVAPTAYLKALPICRGQEIQEICSSTLF